MIAASQSLRSNKHIRLRPIALPVEHGGWSLLLEPIALGLLLAPSRSGALLSVSAVALFLARHPGKLAINDWRNGRRGQRTKLAQGFALAYFLVAVLAAALAIKIGGMAFLFPLGLAAPFLIIQSAFDAVNRSRSLVAELAGSIATGSMASAIAISGGWPRSAAFALWAIMAARSAPTILYLRARLRLMRQRPASSGIAIAAHLFALLAVLCLAWSGLAPWLGVLAMGVLLVRAFLGLLSSRPVTPQRLGVGELLFGIFAVASVFLGYRWGW